MRTGDRRIAPQLIGQEATHLLSDLLPDDLRPDEIVPVFVWVPGEGLLTFSKTHAVDADVQRDSDVGRVAVPLLFSCGNTVRDLQQKPGGGGDGQIDSMRWQKHLVVDAIPTRR